MGALLLIATATSAGLFGRQLSEIKAQTDNSLATTLTSMDDDIRYAWWASVPDTRHLTLSDPSGAQTLYAFANGVLSVTRPGGTTGTVLGDVATCSFSAQTLTRYREATPATRDGTFWSASAPAGSVVQVQVNDPGDHLALGFTLGSPAPVNGNTPGVQDQLTSTTISTLSIALAAVETANTVAPIVGNVTIDLYRARSPGDGRPEGSSLGTLAVAMTGLPVAAGYVVDTATGNHVHVPNGNAWGWWKHHAGYQLVVTPPAGSVAIDLTPLAAVVQPGYAYTLVLGSTLDGVAYAVYPIASAVKSGVALDVAGGGYNAQALAVVRSFTGTMSMTRTTATTVTNRVLVDIVRNDGTEISGSTLLIGQGMADDNWLGVVPGETGP